MNRSEAEVRALAAADALFYTKGMKAVAMHDIRDASGVSLKLLYQCFPSKNALIAAYLDHRDRTYRTQLREFVDEASEDPRERILAVFDSLEAWFQQDDFRGCAYINAYGELGGTEPWVGEVVRDHKVAIRTFLAELLDGVPVEDSERLSYQLLLLIDGALVSAALHDDPSAACHAKAAATQLLGPAGSA